MVGTGAVGVPAALHQLTPAEGSTEELWGVDTVSP